jgi:hypothetical protein
MYCNFLCFATARRMNVVLKETLEGLIQLEIDSSSALLKSKSNWKAKDGLPNISHMVKYHFFQII